MCWRQRSASSASGAGVPARAAIAAQRGAEQAAVVEEAPRPEAVSAAVGGVVGAIGPVQFAGDNGKVIPVLGHGLGELDRGTPVQWHVFPLAPLGHEGGHVDVGVAGVGTVGPGVVAPLDRPELLADGAAVLELIAEQVVVELRERRLPVARDVGGDVLL